MREERRQHPRRTVMRRAIVMLGRDREIDCTVRNISRAGAMLLIEQQIQLPPRFVLDMSGNIAVKRLCELVWQDGLVAGVKFSKLSGFESIQFDLR